MILLVAVCFGLMLTLGRSYLTQRSLHVPHWRWIWLVLLGFVPQLWAFYLPTPLALSSDAWVAVSLVCSQVGLLIFILGNCHEVGFRWLGLGLALNLAVISLNGGLMPISPDTLVALHPDTSVSAWSIGQRLGKDIILPVSDTWLWLLSDCLVLRAQGWLDFYVAYSLGDIFIAAGSCLTLWHMSDPAQPEPSLLTRLYSRGFLPLQGGSG